MITRICNNCGKEYNTFPSVNKKFCSTACAGEAKRKTMRILACAQCGKEISAYPSQPNKKFCSMSCAITFRNLTDQNPSYHRDISGDKNPMFGKGFAGEANPMFGRRGENSPRWKGGRKHGRQDGYIMIVVPEDYPNPSMIARNVKYALEHRVVMEAHIGRYLTAQEVVHHIDGNPSNNAIDNLQLFGSQHDHIFIGHNGATHRGKL